MKTNLHETYATDQSAEADGAWIEVRPGIQFRIRSENCAKARDWANRRARSQRQFIIANQGLLPPAMVDKNDVDICSDVLVTGWKGITDDKGVEIPFTKENVIALLKELPALRRDVLFLARTDETFRPSAEVASEMGKTSATLTPQPSVSGETSSES